MRTETSLARSVLQTLKAGMQLAPGEATALCGVLELLLDGNTNSGIAKLGVAQARPLSPQQARRLNIARRVASLTASGMTQKDIHRATGIPRRRQQRLLEAYPEALTRAVADVVAQRIEDRWSLFFSNRIARRHAVAIARANKPGFVR